MGLLVVGFIVIGGALVYKSSQPSSPSPAVTSAADYSLAAVKVPAGADVISATAGDGKLTVTFKNGQTTSIRIFDGKTGEMLREVPVVSE